jgi:hypothetical protein
MSISGRHHHALAAGAEGRAAIVAPDGGAAGSDVERQ